MTVPAPPSDAPRLDAAQLRAYLARIGYDGAPTPDLATLSRLHTLHLRAFPFENLTPYTGGAVDLAVPALMDKFVRRGRGGYCFEQNGLLRAVLNTVGFAVVPLIARVQYMRPAGLPAPGLTHMVLRVDLQEAGSVVPYFVDVGFGAVAQDLPLRGDPGAIGSPQSMHGGTFRLVPLPLDGALDPDYQLQFKTPTGVWAPVYRFSPTHPAADLDYVISNWYSSTHANARFVNELVLARVEGDGHRTVFNDTVTFRRFEASAGDDAGGDGGEGERKASYKLESAAQLQACLQDEFGLDFDADAVWAKLQATMEKRAKGG